MCMAANVLTALSLKIHDAQKNTKQQKYGGLPGAFHTGALRSNLTTFVFQLRQISYLLSALNCLTTQFFFSSNQHLEI